MGAVKKSNKGVLVLLAHHDDEFFLGLHLKHLETLFETVYLCYLTYTPHVHEQRVLETLNYTKALGLSKTSVIEIGKKVNILDGQLYTSLDKAEGAIKEFLISSHCESVIFPSWEGGHHDHDAIFVLGSLLGKSLGLKMFDFGLYSCSRVKPPFFGMSGFYQTEKKSPWIETGGYFARLSQSLLAWIFRSQWKSFVGLWPGFFWHRLLGRKVFLGQPDELSVPVEAPHPGVLHYEYRFKVEWSRFRSEIDKFVANHRQS